MVNIDKCIVELEEAIESINTNEHRTACVKIAYAIGYLEAIKILGGEK